MSSTPPPAPGPQHGNGRTGRATLLLRGAAALVAVLAVVVAAALAGSKANTASIEPPANGSTATGTTEAATSTPTGSASADTPTGSTSTGPASTPAVTPSARTTPQTRTAKPKVTPTSPASQPASSPAPTRVKKPPASPTKAPTKRPTSQPTPSSEPAPPSLVDGIVSRTNAERLEAGLPALKVSPCATKQAAARTKKLVEEDRFEHDPLGPIVDACGSGTVGENLALGYPTAKAVVAGWMDSEGHRANILGKQYTKIGVGCTKGPDGQLCGQVFLG